MQALHEKFMRRCLDLAEKGGSYVAPNPKVGSVIVHENRIIGEGFHQVYGQAHAERNAINAVVEADKHLLPESTLYVNLEPCSFQGHQPPCANLLIATGIKKVVVGDLDPNPKVAGNGMKMLEEAGIQVTQGILKKECAWQNRRFKTFHLKKRPYIVLKWAQTIDGYIAPDNEHQKWISNQLTKRISHRWRTEEQAIMVGRKTAQVDNPQLTARLWTGKNPLRLVLDQRLLLANDLHLFDSTTPTVIFTAKNVPQKPNVAYARLDYTESIPHQVAEYLYNRPVISVLIEGGPTLLKSFIQANLWDEARIFIGNQYWGSGKAAPSLSSVALHSKEQLGDNELKVLLNTQQMDGNV